MVRFDRYLCEAQTRMNLAPMQLIREWRNEEVNSIIIEMRSAVITSQIIGSTIPNLTGTNQSKGNQVEKYFVSKLSNQWKSESGIFDAPGKGYPDRIFRVENCRSFMEIKATSNWSENDSIRRVLTAKPEKMRNLVNSNAVDQPPAHFICTIVYSEPNSNIISIRMDFIDPNTEIDVRFEASTSQKRLTNGGHKTEIFS